MWSVRQAGLTFKVGLLSSSRHKLTFPLLLKKRPLILLTPQCSAREILQHAGWRCSKRSRPAVPAFPAGSSCSRVRVPGLCMACRCCSHVQRLSSASSCESSSAIPRDLLGLQHPADAGRGSRKGLSSQHVASIRALHPKLWQLIRYCRPFCCTVCQRTLERQ